MKQLPACMACSRLWHELEVDLPLSPWRTARTTLERYIELLLKTKHVPNLMARSQRDANSLWEHVFDSLHALHLLVPGEDQRLMDVGSGNGLPGIPLAIALPGLHVQLVERSTRKSAFLEFVVALLELSNVTVIASEFSASLLRRERPDLTTLRAAVPDERFLSLLPPASDTCPWLVFCTSNGAKAWVNSAEPVGYRAVRQYSYELFGRKAERVILKLAPSEQPYSK